MRPCPTREGRGRRKALLLLTVAALVLTLGLFRAAQQWSLGLGSGQVGVLEVESLDVDVDHHSGQAVLRGRIGAQSFGAEVDDDVQISVALSEPAYCYLLALNPDGQVQLCWPEDEGRPPPRVKALLYPTGGQVFGLTDGEGLQGFLVAAAREPLPAYGQWRARLSALPWTRTQAEGVWCFDEGRLLRVSSQGSQESGKDSRTRGQVRNLRGIQPFSMICETLRSRPEFNSVRAIAFPVKGGN